MPHRQGYRLAGDPAMQDTATPWPGILRLEILLCGLQTLLWDPAMAQPGIPHAAH